MKSVKVNLDHIQIHSHKFILGDISERDSFPCDLQKKESGFEWPNIYIWVDYPFMLSVTCPSVHMTTELDRAKPNR